MSNLHSIVEEALIAHSGKSVINVMMFGHDEETEQMISNYPSAYFLTLDDSTCYAADIIVCVNNTTKEDIDKISDLVRSQSVDTVIIEESENGKLSNRNTAGIHQNGYKYFTCIDHKTPHVIVYSNTSEVISLVESYPYKDSDTYFVSTHSSRLSNVPFTIVGGETPLTNPDDLDDYLFGFDNKGDED